MDGNQNDPDLRREAATGVLVDGSDRADKVSLELDGEDVATGVAGVALEAGSVLLVGDVSAAAARAYSQHTRDASTHKLEAHSRKNSSEQKIL